MNYIGSKYSLLNFLDESIGRVTGLTDGIFCDLFAGTGVVGLRFKQKGFKVISNDIQYYSYVLNKHLIENHTAPEFKGLIKIIPELAQAALQDRPSVVCESLNNTAPAEGYIYQNYSMGGTKNSEFQRQYFTDYNAKKCDAIRAKIEKWKCGGGITEGEYWFLLSSLLQCIDKVANTASVYGAFLKHIKKTACQDFCLKPVQICVNEQSHSVYNQNANDLVKTISADIVYIDPPYNHRQYSANYHILETIALNDNPIIKGKTGLRMETDKNSAYCSKRSVKAEFSDLIRNIKAKYIFVSYNNEGLLSKDDLKEILSSRGCYGCIEQDYKRYRGDTEKNRNIGTNKTVEYLHYVECVN